MPTRWTFREVQAGVNYGAITVDHLEHTGPEEWDALAGSDTLPVLLPGSTFSGDGLCPRQEMIRRGLPVALATNYNPGSCPAGNMQFMMTLACLKMKLTPEEAVNASTLNGAHGMDCLPGWDRSPSERQPMCLLLCRYRPMNILLTLLPAPWWKPLY